MNITREQCEYDLRSGGLTQRVMYLGFFPVNVPVHDMTADMRSMVLQFCIDSLDLMAQNLTPPTPNSVLSLVLGQPKLLAKHVDIVISAQYISLIHDDEQEREKIGNLIFRVPMKFTSVIERMENTDSFAFIAKRLDGTQRKCAVFKTERLELADHIMQIMEHAMTICNEEQQARVETDGSESGSVTPVGTPLAPSTSFPPHNYPVTPTHPAPPPVLPPPLPAPASVFNPPPMPSRSKKMMRTNILGVREAPLSTTRINLGPKAHELAQYRWYHGLLSRTDASNRLNKAGEFLIRESENQRGQVILSGMNDQEAEKHLLLIDQEGKVKTQDKDFESIADLVKYYTESGAMIVMANEAQLRLQFPVDRPH